MDDQRHERELLTLKTIAETLNRSIDLKPMLQSVLEELLKVTGLKTGWIFLSRNRNEFTCEADVQLPHALAMNEKKPMCSGSCWCLTKYWGGRLNEAVNIIECKRLEDALISNSGDTEGLTHHATVPLAAAGETFGLLNVGSPGKEKFTEEELTLLESVAFQIGTAIKRIILFQNEQKRVENFSKLETLTRKLWKREQVDAIVHDIIEHTSRSFNWPIVGYFVQNGKQLILHSIYENCGLREMNLSYSIDDLKEVMGALQKEESVMISETPFPFLLGPAQLSAHAVTIRNEQIGILFALSHKKRTFETNECEVLRALAAHMALAIEQARINEKRQELIISEERNRLARDLHDSVSQKLFSLSMTARGAQSLQNDFSLLTDSLEDIQHLSQEAMKEMRTLIWQLRPVGIEAGTMTSLQSYASGLGLQPVCHVTGLKQLPTQIEEALFRIGQESLNNVQKHARVKIVSLHLHMTDDSVTLTIQDAGLGFNQTITGEYTLGLRGMKERATQLGGTLSITSERNKGTTVKTVIPITK
ncbi:MAG: GAF domain-containing sensor histidine kinase [Anaerobacillus sp.]